MHRLLVASVCLMVAGGCRDNERYTLWPPLHSVGDTEAYFAMSSLLCSNASSRFTHESHETGTVEILAIDDGATKVKSTATSQHSESTTGGRASPPEAGVLIGRDVIAERTGPRQWRRSLVGRPPDNEAEREAIADTTGPFVSEPEDYPKHAVGLHEEWPVSISNDIMRLTGTCSIAKIEGTDPAKVAVVECTHTGSLEGFPLSSMTSRESISLLWRRALGSEYEAHFSITKEKESFACSMLSLLEYRTQ